MVKFETLNELSQLRDSGFNQPPPRHGLNLLYWFAKVSVNQLKPETGAFGFHRFHNRINDDTLLSNQNDLFYEVGNLNAQGAENLPKYVRRYYDNPRYTWNNNKDRIIVQMCYSHIERVYVTEHMNQKDFDPSRTYRVSMGLLNQIRVMGREEFLNRMKKNQVTIQVSNLESVDYTEQNRTNSSDHNTHQNQRREDESFWSWCTIL